MVTALLLISQSAIAARMCSRLVQVDVDLWVTEMLVAACAGDNSLLAFDNRLFCNQVDSPALVDNLGGIREADISVIILIVCLKAERNPVVNKMLFNHITTTINRFLYLTRVCHFGAFIRHTKSFGSLCGDCSSVSPIAQLWQACELSDTRHFHVNLARIFLLQLSEIVRIKTT